MLLLIFHPLFCKTFPQDLIEMTLKIINKIGFTTYPVLCCVKAVDQEEKPEHLDHKLMYQSNLISFVCFHQWFSGRTQC